MPNSAQKGVLVWHQVYTPHLRLETQVGTLTELLDETLQISKSMRNLGIANLELQAATSTSILMLNATQKRLLARYQVYTSRTKRQKREYDDKENQRRAEEDEEDNAAATLTELLDETTRISKSTRKLGIANLEIQAATTTPILMPNAAQKRVLGEHQVFTPRTKRQKREYDDKENQRRAEEEETDNAAAMGVFGDMDYE